MTSRFTVRRADALELLRSLPDASVDLVVTDPAYESLEEHRSKGTTTRLTNDWFPIFKNDRYPKFFRELYRVLKRNTHCYVLCDQKTMFVIKPLAEAEGFKFWKPLVWDKMKIGMGYHYRAQYEVILFFEKGKRKLNDLGISDVISVPRVAGGQFVDDWRKKRADYRKAYPTEKPVELLETLVLQSSKPGELVVDPFLGSGSTGEAALKHGRCFLGGDVLAKSLDLALPRLAATVANTVHFNDRI